MSIIARLRQRRELHRLRREVDLAYVVWKRAGWEKDDVAVTFGASSPEYRDAMVRCCDAYDEFNRLRVRLWRTEGT